MHRHARADDGEQCVDRVAVDRLEVDRMLEQAEGHERRAHAQQDGIADVGDGDAAADPGGAHGLPRFEHGDEEVAIHVLRQWEPADDFSQHRSLVTSADVVVDPAGREQVAELWSLVRVVPGLLEQSLRYRNALFGRPFPQLDGVQMQAFVDVMRRQPTRSDPASHGRIIHPEVRGGLPYGQLHGENINLLCGAPALAGGILEAVRNLQFLGAAGTVTGSMHLVRAGAARVLLDCGLFQGLKELRLRNWGPPRVAARELDAVVLSHAHLDHSGYLPLVVRHGFRGPIYCTPGTGDLLRILLADAAHLEEEAAERANRRGYSKHRPALPLFTGAEALAVLDRIELRAFGSPFDVAPGVSGVFRRAGHILGAATTELILDGGGPLRLAYSGDLGRPGRPILHDPEPIPEARVLVLESTYGDRQHAAGAEEQLAHIVREAAARGGAILVPAFAVGRMQELLWLLRRLEEDGRIPALPVYLDSPMGIEAGEIYLRHREEHDVDMAPLRTRTFTLARTAEESKRLNDMRGPVVIIAGSGMATGGRILHHLAQRLPDQRTTVVLAGFQAAGTRGRSLRDGATVVRMLGQDVPVRARVEVLDAMSAHADRGEILQWLGGFRRPPERTYLVHGEPAATVALAEAIRRHLGWEARTAADGETVEL